MKHAYEEMCEYEAWCRIIERTPAYLLETVRVKAAALNYIERRGFLHRLGDHHGLDDRISHVDGD
jgi:hypothetical protein